MTELEGERIDSILRGLHAILEMSNLDEGVEKLVRKILGLLEDESRTQEEVVKSLEKMLRRAPMTPEAAALRLMQQIRASAGSRKPPLGPAFGPGTRPREKSEDDPALHAAVDQLMEKIRKVKRTGVRGGV